MRDDVADNNTGGDNGDDNKNGNAYVDVKLDAVITDDDGNSVLRVWMLMQFGDEWRCECERKCIAVILWCGCDGSGDEVIGSDNVNDMIVMIGIMNDDDDVMVVITLMAL